MSERGKRKTSSLHRGMLDIYRSPAVILSRMLLPRRQHGGTSALHRKSKVITTEMYEIYFTQDLHQKPLGKLFPQWPSRFRRRATSGARPSPCFSPSRSPTMWLIEQRLLAWISCTSHDPMRRCVLKALQNIINGSQVDLHGMGLRTLQTRTLVSRDSCCRSSCGRLQLLSFAYCMSRRHGYQHLQRCR